MEERTILELGQAMQSGETTSQALVKWYLQRIETLDRNGPSLDSVLETNPDALVIAEERDQERTNGQVRGPLHGIPLLLKDNMATADNMTTTAGSLALEGCIAPHDAFLVTRLREAGSVLLGKTNLSEWANFRSSFSSSGWSSRGGQCLNPYVLDCSPCGSSSGSGVAVSANLAAAALGTETDGSIMCPSSYNGIVGIKPTVGLVSRTGIIPISASQDTAGPMARTVEDAALLLGCIAGVDPEDPVTAESEGRAHDDYTQFLDPNALRGARIGVARESFWGYSEHTDRIGEAAIATIRELGAEVIDPVSLRTSQEMRDAEFEVLLYEFKDGLNRYLRWLGVQAPTQSLQELIEFNTREAVRTLPYFGQDVLLLSQQKGPLSEEGYIQARATSRRLSREEGIDAVIEEHRLDAILAPTGSPAFKIDLVNGDHFLGGSSSSAAIAGYPAITVPAGYAFGLPVGITFFGVAYSEPTLLRLSFAFEQATKVRQPPRFLKTLSHDSGKHPPVS